MYILSPSPSPSPPPEPPSQSQPSNFKTLTARKPQPVPWTHQETVHLIQAYQEKWYSLKRGQLKASQWEEVAVTVAARCGYDYNHLAKSVIQCRHKMEKLRKRHRDERRRMSVTGGCFWQYFDLMESLECGPMPISARPLALVPPTDNADEEEEEDQEAEAELEEEEEEGYRSKSRSINYILRKPTIVNRFANSGFACEAVIKRKREEKVEEEKEEERGKGIELKLAGEIRAFTERIVRMEKKKMEMMKETEKWRMEMENKRIQMILTFQEKIVAMTSAAFNSQQDFNFEGFSSPASRPPPLPQPNLSSLPSPSPPSSPFPHFLSKSKPKPSGSNTFPPQLQSPPPFPSATSSPMPLSYFDADDELQTTIISSLNVRKKSILFVVRKTFNPTYSQKHLPGFMEKSKELKAKGIDTNVCISMNCAFLMKAWKQNLRIKDEVLLLSYGNGEFTKKICCKLNLSDKPVRLRVRSRRYAILAEDGVVKVLNLEEGRAFTFNGAWIS